MTKLLVIWDFDETFTEQHTERHPGSGVLKQHAQFENSKAKQSNMRHPLILQIIINYLHELGHENAIASFHQGTERNNVFEQVSGNDYIYNYVKIGMPYVNIDAMHIISDMADSDIVETYGKKFIIEAHVDAFNRRNPDQKIDLSKPEDAARVIFIDNDANNIRLARQQFGIEAIEAVVGFDKQEYLLKIIDKIGLPSKVLMEKVDAFMKLTATEHRREQSFIARLIKAVQQQEAKASADKKVAHAAPQKSPSVAPTILNPGMERKQKVEATHADATHTDSTQTEQLEALKKHYTENPDILKRDCQILYALARFSAMHPTGTWTADEYKRDMDIIQKEITDKMRA